MSWWFNKVNDGNRKRFITDSCTSHINVDLKKRIRDKGICLYVFSAFKNQYYECAEEFLELNGARSKLKLTSPQKRILCTRLTSSTWARTFKLIDFQATFRSLGFTWTDGSIIPLNDIK
ncbi:unnamed protein product [Adineta steineri]|uniref:DDE-1 domain-containing protein n=1 Tax=Adineta steineri TaxID=433720 RepID=A0A814D4Y1_9BILA|nr:unnamed protein product [Adineta steineri]CAF4004420.1 unnamed protein product [Adineta steineri]